MTQFFRRMGFSAGLVGVAVAALAVLGFVANGRLLFAQNGSHIRELRELEHDTSPPLDKIPPLPPEAGPKREVPFHPTHGRFAPEPEAQADQAIQAPSGTSAPSTDHNYLGLGTGFPGFSVQYIPPDTNGAVGDTQFVQWVNASFAVLKKSDGSVEYGPAAGNTLWSNLGGACARNNSGDPIAQYDELNSRWVLMQPVFKSPYSICVAVSTGSDAMGPYNLYAFPVPNKLFPDYPKLGIWSDGYYLTYNQFQGNFFQGAAACALDGASMRAGTAATMQCTAVNPAYGSLLPADFDGTAASGPPGGSPAYFLNFDGDHQSLDLWQFHVDWNNPNNSTFSGPTKIGVTAFGEACGGGDCIPQKGTAQTLDSLGDRLMYRLAYRNLGSYESMVVSHSVDTGNGYTGVRWYELRNTGSGFDKFQESTYAPDSNYRWMPSIAMDKNGNIAMGYSVSSSSMSPTIKYTGRLVGDASGQMGTETDLLGSAIGHGSQTSYARWGDYASMAVDPTDDCTFWFTTEYQPTNGVAWSTRIASFKFSDCPGGTGSADFSMSASPSSLTLNPGQNGTSTVSVTALNGFTGTVGFTVTGCPASPAACVMNPTSVTGSGNSTLAVSTDNTTTPGSYNVMVTGTSGSLSHAATVVLAVNSAPTASFTFSCNGLVCNFDGSGSTDSDGTISSYAWTFGDGGTGSGKTASHTYNTASTYSVTLTVTDNGGLTGISTHNVTVSQSTGINLTATGYKVKGVQMANLSWVGASGSVNVKRDGATIATTSATTYTDNINKKGGGSYNYQVCETSGAFTCSNIATVTF